MNNNDRWFNFKISDSLHFQLKTMSLLKHETMSDVLRDLIKKVVSDFIDNYEGPLSPEADENLRIINKAKERHFRKLLHMEEKR